MNGPPHHFDVAISVDSANVNVAEELDSRLRRRGLTVFTYTEAPGQTAGPDLEQSLQKIYGTAQIVVFVLSNSWSTSYTQTELSAASSGVAADDGLWLLRLDDSPLPEGLQGRVWWPSDRSLEELSLALARRLGRRSLARWQEGALAILASVLLGFVAYSLGFIDLGRGLDQVAWTGVFLPAAWGLAFRLGPDIRQALSRSQSRKIAVETPLERTWDRWSGVSRWLGLASMVILAAYVVTERHEVLRAIRALDKAVELVGSTYGELRLSLNQGTTQVTRVSFSPTEEQVRAFQRDAKLVQEKSNALRVAVRDALGWSGPINASEVERLLDKVHRTLVVNIGHQVEVIGNPSSSVSRERIARDSLIGYNTLLAESMNNLEKAVRELQQQIRQEQAEMRTSWHGLIE